MTSTPPPPPPSPPLRAPSPPNPASAPPPEAARPSCPATPPPWRCAPTGPPRRVRADGGRVRAGEPQKSPPEATRAVAPARQGGAGGRGGGRCSIRATRSQTPWLWRATLSRGTPRQSPSTPNATPYTLHPTPCTLHPTPYALHPTPYTLRSAPYTVYLFQGAHAGLPRDCRITLLDTRQRLLYNSFRRSRGCRITLEDTYDTLRDCRITLYYSFNGHTQVRDPPHQRLPYRLPFHCSRAQS